MHYSNMRCHHAMLGDKVKTSHHIDAEISIVKKIDTLNEQVYIVPLDGSRTGAWYSGNALFYIVETYNAKQ